MEEKGILENIISITEKLFSGLTSFGKKDLSEQLESLADTLKQVAKEKRKLTEDESETLLKIFVSSARPDFSKDFMNKIDKEVFYDFGCYLDDQLTKQGKNLKLISHEYLNLFRFPVFLRKIYDEKKWEKLTHDLILKSNYNTSVLFNQRLRDYENKSLFKIIKGNSVTAYSWKKSSELINTYKKALKKLTGSKEDKVTFLLDNCLEMVLLDLACLTGGIVNVMIPANSVNEHIKFILQETGSTLLLVQDEKQLSKIKGIKSELPQLQKVILLESSSSEEWVINFSDFSKYGKESASDNSNEQSNNVDMTSLATIMYTSGTTGEPKGIMFSQMNIIYKRFCRAMAIPEIGDKDRFLCFLPLYHTFGRYLEMTGSVFWAAEYCFLENPSVETMISNMQLVRPSVFISIPKKWIQLYEYITSKVDIELDDENKIKGEVEKATGGNLKWGLSAAGYLPSDIFQFFQNYGIELMSGFGMTEATGGITMTPPHKYRPNSLGKALPGIEIKLGDDGEILIKGPYVMLGYFNTDNSETFIEDGWLPSGDVMKMDEDGFIEIIDRKKEIYKNIKGETIAPQKIENLFRDFENVKQVFLAGDHRQFNTVLIHPNYDDEDSPLHNMEEKQKQEYFSSVIVTVNKFLAPFERILDFRLIDRPFSDKYGELTPKGTYKRKIIEKNFSELIESMYVKNHTTLYVNNTEVRVPNWFLREKGSLSRDILSNQEKILFPKLKLSLTVKRTDKQNVIQIGNYYYVLSAPYIDLQLLLTDPALWIGNKEFKDFTGNSIIQWHRQIAESKQIKFHSPAAAVTLEENEKQHFQKIISSSEISLQGIHLAYTMLLTDEQDQSKSALEYYDKVFNDRKNLYHKLVMNLLSRPNITGKVKTKRELFTTVIQRADDKSFEEIFKHFLNDDPLLLNSSIIQSIVENIRGDRKLKFLEDFIKAELEKTRDISSTLLPDMFELITVYGIRHPVNYRRVRRFLMRIALLTSDPILKDLVEKNLLALREGFREWLGPNQKVAIDVETSEEYVWEDVLTFEEGIDTDDRFRIKNAIIKTPFLREAIFMFSGGLQLRLDNILPGGIWISLLEAKSEKSIYRLTVQTRYQGAFDITIHLNKNLPPAVVREEIKWLILAGTNLKGDRLLPFFGGYWEEYELWTEAFVPRDSVARFLERELKRKEPGYQQRLSELWPHFVWNAAAAYMNFWKLTNYQVELTNPMPENVTVPTHDYQTGTLLYSVSRRNKSTSVYTFFTNFYNLFVVNTVENFQFLEKKSIWNYIFSGITECEGETKAIDLIRKFVEELKPGNEQQNELFVTNKAQEFIKSIEIDGFIPRALFFAIKRFHRWHILNQDADLNAQAEMLYELYETYQLFELEKEHPSTRTVFFLRTAFKNSSENLREELNAIAKKQAADEITKEAVQKHYSMLHLLPGLNNAEIFFLTRLSYPYLKPKDTAAMLKAESLGDESNLVIQLTDEEGSPFIIRSPISPKEISRLQALFLESNLMVHFSPEHRFLVALSERGFIIGGLFHKRTDEQTAHMEKIVVSSHYRRKGISEALMSELLNRLRSEHIKFVTTGFFRPEYFYRFGFRIEKKYSGLVADLSALSGKI